MDAARRQAGQQRQHSQVGDVNIKETQAQLAASQNVGDVNIKEIRNFKIEEIHGQLEASQLEQVRLSMLVDSLWNRFLVWESNNSNGAFADIAIRLGNVEGSVKRLEEEFLQVPDKGEEKEIPQHTVLNVQESGEKQKVETSNSESSAVCTEDSAESSMVWQADVRPVPGQGNVQALQVPVGRPLTQASLDSDAPVHDKEFDITRNVSGDYILQHKTSRESTSSPSIVSKIKTYDASVSLHHECPSSYHLQESVWDLAMFIGMKQIGFLGSVQIAFLVTVNACMQFLLCLLINDYFTVRKLSDKTVDEMRRWRWSSGHSWEIVKSLQVDRQSFQPLAQRICDKDGSVPMSGRIAHILAQIAEYAPTQNDYDMLEPYIARGDKPMLPFFPNVGMLMCQLAIVIWLLLVASEVSQTLSFSMAVTSIPAGTSKLELKGDGIVWQSMTHHRKALCVFISAVKVVVAVCLGITGVIYLCFTISIGDLLLNCGALQIVLELDELVFHLMPHHARDLLAHVKPMRHARGHISWKGLDVGPVLAFTGILVLIAVIKIQVLQPQYDILIAAREQICGGNKDFIVVRDNAGVAFASYVPPPEPHVMTYSGFMVSELIQDPNAVWRGQEFAPDGSFSLSSVPNGLIGSQWSMTGIEEMSVGKISDAWNPRCVDILASPKDDVLDGVAKMFKLILEEELHVRKISMPITTCATIKTFCNHESSLGIRARQVCPESCGCTNPGSTLVMTTEDAGCPLFCTQTDSYKALASSQGCKDEPADGAMLSSWLHGVQDYLGEAPDEYAGDLKILIARVRSNGCSNITDGGDNMIYKWDDLCVLSSNWLLRPLAFACPEACACSTRALLYCPPACR